MSRRGFEGPAVDLARARDRIEAWRSRRERGRRIPAHLWALGVQLAKRYGVSRTATTLGLEYYGLKRHLEAGVEPAACEPTAFVELPAPLATGKHCRAELRSESGAELRLDLSGYEATDLAALVGSLWSAA
jgi:hypothetical protein